MNELDMEYNSSREELIIPEYGRNVQNLIGYAKNLEDSRLRQSFVEKIVDLMMQMHPQNRNAEDYRDKLWRHVFHIAGYDLDVLPPTGVKPRPEDAHKKPDKIPYPQPQSQYRHYGSNVQRLIRKAISMNPGSKRDGFVAVIGAYMKLAYKTWNKEHYVSDDVIKGDLIALSDGRLSLDEDMSLDNLSNNRGKRPNKPQRNGNGGYSNQGNYPRDRDRDNNYRNKNNPNNKPGGRRKK